MAKRILIVEQDESVRRFFKIALRGAGFETQEASDGLVALRLIEEQQPDLVVLDLDLPSAVNGFTVQQDIAAHAQHRRIPIVIVTDFSAKVDHLDVACVLRKPVSSDQVVDAVRQCLRSVRRD